MSVLNKCVRTMQIKDKQVIASQKTLNAAAIARYWGQSAFQKWISWVLYAFVTFMNATVYLK